MSDLNLDSADLKAALEGGIINESVMQQIIDISDFPLPFTDLAGNGGKVGNSYHEWTEDKLDPANSLNAKVDGAILGGNQARAGTRMGNHCQISTKVVAVSTRARNSDVVGQSDSLSYNVMQRLKELRRDTEKACLAWNASVADDGNLIPGVSASFGSFLTSNVFRGVGGLNGGFGATIPTIIDAPTSGASEALSETNVRDVSQAIYENGGDPTVAMTTPAVKRKFSEYLYTDEARVAVLDQDVGNAAEQATAKGAVDVYLSDFSILKLVPNRLQPSQPAVNNTCMYLIDPEMVEQVFLHGYRTEPQGKKGLSDERQMIVDWSLRVGTELAHGCIADINPGVPAIG